MARAVLAEFFSGEPLNIMTAISYGECKRWTGEGGPLQGYYDAVGDWKILDPSQPTYSLLAAKTWRPSINFCQIRCLHNPRTGYPPDSFRDNHKLHLDVRETARAAWEISLHGTNFLPWSVFKSGVYLQWVSSTFDYELVLGHPDANRWNMYDIPPSL